MSKSKQKGVPIAIGTPKNLHLSGVSSAGLINYPNLSIPLFVLFTIVEYITLSTFVKVAIIYNRKYSFCQVFFYLCKNASACI